MLIIEMEDTVPFDFLQKKLQKYVDNHNRLKELDTEDSKQEIEFHSEMSKLSLAHTEGT